VDEGGLHEQEMSVLIVGFLNLYVLFMWVKSRFGGNVYGVIAYCQPLIAIASDGRARDRDVMLNFGTQGGRVINLEAICLAYFNVLDRLKVTRSFISRSASRS
jgi:hypothetical protein